MIYVRTPIVRLGQAAANWVNASGVLCAGMIALLESCVVEAVIAMRWSGTDERRSLRVDQLLIERLGRCPDPIGDIGEFLFPSSSRRADWSRATVRMCLSV